MTQMNLLDYPASYWDGPARKAARAKNPHGQELDNIDSEIDLEYDFIKETEAFIRILRQERIALLNDDEKACNLLSAIASFSENEKIVKAMTIEQLAENAFSAKGDALNEAVISEILERAGYVYKEEEEVK